VTIVRIFPLPTDGFAKWALIVQPSPGQDKSWDLEGNEGIEGVWAAAWNRFAKDAGAAAFIASRSEVVIEDHFHVVAVADDVKVQASGLFSRVSTGPGGSVPADEVERARESFIYRVICDDGENLLTAIERGADAYRRMHRIPKAPLTVHVKGGATRLTAEAAALWPPTAPALDSEWVEKWMTDRGLVLLAGVAATFDCDALIYLPGRFAWSKTS
jgi:hypothetical protein